VTGVACLSRKIDESNDMFTNGVKDRILPALPNLDARTLEWLAMEHYQFSSSNVGFLQSGVASTARLAEQGVTIELRRNADEEDGHARMYRQAMLDIGTDVDQRVEFPPTTQFLAKVGELARSDPSRALGALYATETAAIFEHETFFEICKHLCRHRGIPYDGTRIKAFHALHLDGVEQGHKDGLAAFVDLDESPQTAEGLPINQDAVEHGALAAIKAMRTWWDAMLERAGVAPAGA